MRIKPRKFDPSMENGWYIHIDFEHQKTTPEKYGKKAYGGWFYEYSEGNIWRTESGCADCGPFDENDLFIGPINLEG